MKIAIIHEFLTDLGGAERVLRVFLEMFPEAKLYVLVKNKTFPGDILNKPDITTSFLQKLPSFIRRHHKFLLPFYPIAVENFDLSSFDLVISNSNSFAKGVIVPQNCLHVCYCHSPTRYLWDYTHQYLKEQGLSNILHPFVIKLLDKLRIWDFQAAQRVDYFIANSKNIQKRIQKYYRRKSVVIYPPVDLLKFPLNLKPKRKSYFLAVARLSPYKKIDLLINVFSKLKETLIVIGTGSELKKLKKQSPKNVIFLGYVPDEKLSKYYQNCRALIFPQEEDFGIVPVEAMATGKPVIAYRKGGAEETVIDQKTGLFFESQNEKDIYQAIKRFQKLEDKFDPKEIRKRAEKFSKEIFKKKIKEFIWEKLKELKS